MLPWEKRHIKKNLRELIHMTSCTTSVLAHLVSKNMLSDNDCSRLDSIVVEQNKSSKLYEILQTRCGSYSELHKILSVEKQSGASDILGTGFLEEGPLKISKGIQFNKNIEISRDIGIHKCTAKFYKGTFGGRGVSVKKINSRRDGDGIIWNEVDLILKSDAHENIIRYLTIEKNGYSAVLALEPFLTTLQKWITGNNYPTISKRDVLRQATYGVAHLHSLQIVHGNLKPENILLCEVSAHVVRVKVADFRVGKLANKSSDLNDFRYTVITDEGAGWMPAEVLQILEPEMFKQSASCEMFTKLTFASDVFSLGCMYYYVMTGGKHPFGNHLRREGNILDNIRTMETDANYDLVKKMTEINTLRRPTSAEILNDFNFWSQCFFKI